MRVLSLLLFWAVLLTASQSVARLVSLEGEVHVRRANMLMLFKKGMELTAEDVIDSREDGKARIVFHDETVVTVGSNTTFAIEKYINDEKNSQMQLDSRRGALRVITGKIGKVAPDQFKVKTRTATIGVRGTQFIVTIEENKEKFLCTEGVIELTPEAKPRSFSIDDLVKPPFLQKKELEAKEPQKLAVLTLGAGEVAEATLPTPIVTPDTPELVAPPKVPAISFETRKADEEEAGEIVAMLQDDGGLVLDKVEVINEYREIMELPPEEPLIIRPISDPSPSKLKVPSLKDSANPKSLRQELTPVR